ncbi:succinylglutamate desuccinylase/aspartoacylase family protein [Ferrimonas kyonanensis]|uniref:succinylglutamate desuccinylase/aspartoacylase family protein n=1 Tax=Ferrimonas kyonanensis TaxID=364763 RepID=UPI000486D448|nr:succinylglutamate desuccinylase/aspartoacylase family protein [Ferrimonas kyonanensis]
MARAKTNRGFEIGGLEVAPGHRRTIQLDVAQLYTHTPLTIPVEVVNGRLEGPVLLISAAIHGDELNGVEVVRQILSLMEPLKLKGTLVAVPVVNVFGLIQKSRYLPDRRDLNRCFPGSLKGSIAARLAHQFFHQVVTRCSHIIDLHTAAVHRTNLPQLRANLDDPLSSAMAQAFGAPVVINASTRDGSLRAVAQAAGIPVLTFEGGEALRFDSGAISMAVKGSIRVMRHLGMLPSRRRSQPKPMVVACATSWVRAAQGGIIRSQVALGAKVKEGSVLAKIAAPLGHDEFTLLAPKEGIVIGQHTLPLVNEGDALFHVAYFEQQQVEEALAQIDSLLDEEPNRGIIYDIDEPGLT